MKTRESVRKLRAHSSIKLPCENAARNDPTPSTQVINIKWVIYIPSRPLGLGEAAVKINPQQFASRALCACSCVSASRKSYSHNVTMALLHHHTLVPTQLPRAELQQKTVSSFCKFTTAKKHRSCCSRFACITRAHPAPTHSTRAPRTRNTVLASVMTDAWLDEILEEGKSENGVEKYVDFQAIILCLDGDALKLFPLTEVRHHSILTLCLRLDLPADMGV